MSLENISKLCFLTGRANETVKKAIANLDAVPKGRALLYESRDALPLIYGIDTQGDYDLTKERARREYHEANMASLKEKQLVGELVHYDVIESHWCEQLSAFKAKLLNLPTKVAHAAINASSIPEIEELIREQCAEALGELKTSAPGLESSPSKRSQRNAKAASETDGESVGGPKPAAKPRSKRRAGAVAH